ncbi:deoxynucleotide monophosphate kinase [Pseudomonas sp. TCU-HL1]|uniref:deoxynucleotide monophosphate kinase family protein n=1 Tax=Pseudomonas sp. TCU-HL1 TaxID=1856685 RepID=UPI0008587BF9|nr:deoxynucleotide monophosphate kinase [Pseudomonas sp. TCU-HL1]AOE86295.1 putative deoxynucleotide monophosphate kinase [Pseudomonas sp. TCU-HL1]
MRAIIGLAALARSGKDTVASMLLTYPGVAAYALADPLKVGCQALFGLTDEEAWHDDIKEKTIQLWGYSPREFFQTVGTEWMRHHNADHWLMRADREINPPALPPSPTFPINLDLPEAPFALASQAIFGFTDDQAWNPDSVHIKDGYWGLSPAEAQDLLRGFAQAMFPDYAARRSARPVDIAKRREQIPQDATTIIIKDVRFENEAAFLRTHHGKIWHIVRPDVLKVKAHSSEFGINKSPEDIVIVNDGSLSDLKMLVDKAWVAHNKNNNK